MFHRRRLALPSSSLSSSTISTSSSLALTSSTLNSAHLPSSLNSPVKGEQDEKVDKIETKNKRVDKKSSGEEKVAILLRDAFGTFKDEVPYYSARLLSIPEASVPGFKELDERYEE